MKIYHNGQVSDIECTLYEPFFLKEIIMTNPDDDNNEIDINSGTEIEKPQETQIESSDEIDINSGT